MSQQKGLDRRTFLKGAALFGGTAATLGMAGCAPKTSEPSSQTSPNAADDITWDEEYDFVVVGGGCGCYAAILAAQSGAKVMLVEKGGTVGGTTALSGNGMWVPNSWLMEDAAKENPNIIPDTEADLPGIVEYALACDPYGIADPDLVKDYVYNASPVIKKMGEMLGIEFVMGLIDDYYAFPGAKFGRQVNFGKDGASLGGSTFATCTEPLMKEHGVEILLNTEAKHLVKNSEGAIVGVQVGDGSKAKNIKAAKGVLLNTGGFDFDENMVKNYLRGPIYGSNSVQTNTGDGHKMGYEVGAAFGNMSSFWGTPFYLTSDNASLSENVVDWMTWRWGDHSIVVNKYGKRFGDETAAYAPATLAYHQYSTKHFAMDNLPGFHIGDQQFVSLYNYPGTSKDDKAAPEWVKTYDTLEELAKDNGIDVEGLLAEVQRWNTFCEAEKDEDFNRPASNWPSGPYFQHDPENPYFGKIETPPFFCAKIGPGTCGTCGGLKVNADAQVIDTKGEVIPGLYASGNCSCGFFGTAYPGPGSTVGSGVYRAARAANHACDLGML